jgi:hypothetical protein
LRHLFFACLGVAVEGLEPFTYGEDLQCWVIARLSPVVFMYWGPKQFVSETIFHALEGAPFMLMEEALLRLKITFPLTQT